jgi:sugar phosphate isomerase/epimerase
LDVLDYQWRIAADFWRETDRLARDHDVKVALELHPQNLVFNSASVHKLIELTGATNLGVELDASHLFWQQMDPVRVVRHLGELVNIEHEDTELGRVEGVIAAAEVLKAADARLRESLESLESLES